MTGSGLPPPSPDWAWFLDIDGTLIDIAPTPSAIHVPPGLVDLLARLSRRCGGALALVSGRSVDNILDLMAPLRLPAAGLHGLERFCSDGRIERPPPLDGLDGVRRALTMFATGHPGVVLEDKRLTLALHYRAVPQLEEACRQAAQAAAVHCPGLAVVAGKMVFELRPAGSDKGVAVRRFMAEPPFAGRPPLFAGDDLTDEDGFAVVNAMGGVSLLVGPPRATAAFWRVESVEVFRQWLAAGA
jgi:trehalose 6-phosphate phosphatase